MSKQKQKVTPSKNQTGGERISGTAKTRSASLPTGTNNMMHWLAALLLILPFIYSNTPLDTNLSVRYIFLCAFMLVFVCWFFLLKKRSFVIPPGLIQLVFVTGAAFTVWSIIGMIGAVNYHEGIYETSRHLLHLVLLYIIMVAVQENSASLLMICSVATFVSLLQSLVGILQFYDIAFTELPGNFKPYGLMANRNLFGSFQAFTLPFVMYVLYAGKRSWKIFAAIALVAAAIALMLSQTRSAWLSGAAVFISSLILILIFVPTVRKKWMVTSLAALVIIAVILGALILGDKESKLSKSVTERAASLAANAKSGSEAEVNISERIKMWKKTMLMVKDHPLTGVGTGNWRIVINSYGLGGTIMGKGIYGPDRTHNTYLQIASETGIPGILFYIGMWVLIAIAGFKLVRTTKDDNKKIITILMLAGLSALAVDSVFSFAVERIEHSIYMLLMAGIILGLYITEKGTVKKQAAKFIMLLPVILFIAFNIFLGKKKFDFESHLKMALYYNNNNRNTETLDEVAKGKNPFFTIDVTANPIETYSGLAYKQSKMYNEALVEFKKAAVYSPYNARIYNDLGTVYWELKDYPTVIANYKKALTYTPEFETILRNLAVTYYASGDYANCIETLGKFNIEQDQQLVAILNDAKNKLAAKKQ